MRAIKVAASAVVIGASDFGASAEEASAVAVELGEAAIDASSGFAEFAATDFVEDVSSGFGMAGCAAFATIVFSCDAADGDALVAGATAAGATGVRTGAFAVCVCSNEGCPFITGEAGGCAV